MKRFVFSALMIFAFHNMLIAQIGFETSTGGGIGYRNVKNLDHVNTPLSPVVSVGFLAKKQIPAGNFSVRSGIEYNYSFRTGRYEFDGTKGVWHSEYYCDDLNTWYGRNFHCISLPVLFSWEKYDVVPVAGVNYNCSFSDSYRMEGVEGRFQNSSHHFGVSLGAEYKLSETISLGLSYKRNLTKDFASEYNSKIIEPKNTQIVFSLTYRFRKK
jgi:opacity protein-like surface antigen